MKCVILAGGLGTRLSEETHLKPKPMVEIGGKPIIWHIMKIYSFYGIKDFIICCGYKGYVIKEYFSNYFIHNSDITVKVGIKNELKLLNQNDENWQITMIDTGEKTETGGRLKRVSNYIDDENFCFTYGDCLSNINLKKLIAFHNEQNNIATLTAVQPPGRFGVLNIDNNKVSCFQEKPIGDNHWVNGGFFVINKSVFDLIESDKTNFEKDVLPNIAGKNELNGFNHNGFWHPMDTLRDKTYLENLYNNDEAPWKIW